MWKRENNARKVIILYMQYPISPGGTSLACFTMLLNQYENNGTRFNKIQ